MTTPSNPQKPPRPDRRRPVVGSRHPTSRPRSVAGRREDLAPAAPAEGTTAPVEGAAPPTAPPAPPPVEPSAPDESEEPAHQEAEPASPGGRRTTLALVAALVVLAIAAAAMGWYLWGVDEPTVSADRPVVIGEVAHRSAVETAQRSAEEILTYGYQDFDAQVEAAQDKMTPEFARQFAQTAADVEDRFVRQRTEQEVKVVAASVVLASPEKVQALLFLDQYVIRQGEGTSITPYRALVTLERGDGGWLVGNIETR